MLNLVIYIQQPLGHLRTVKTVQLRPTDRHGSCGHNFTRALAENTANV